MDAKMNFGKLSIYVRKAKGHHRTINNFSAQCRIDNEYLLNIINGNINSYPSIDILKAIADNSEGKVSLKELELACGYSNYVNGDLEQIKGIYIERGWFVYANLGDKGIIDSEYGMCRIVLIIQNNLGNMKSSTTIVIPLSSKRSRSNMVTHVAVGPSDCDIPHNSIISCEQIKCISKRRLLNSSGQVQKIAVCPDYILQRVDIGVLKANGVIGLYVPIEDAIEALNVLNKGKTKTYLFEENYKTGKVGGFIYND